MNPHVALPLTLACSIAGAALAANGLAAASPWMLAAALIADESTTSVELAHEVGLRVSASDFASFVRVLPRLAADRDIRLLDVRPTDESLESVFAYLVER